MPVISTIYAMQESVNDDYLSLLSVYVKTGDHVTRDALLAEFETSKAVMEVRAEADGYVKVFVQPNTDVKIGSRMFELLDSPPGEAAKTATANEMDVDETLAPQQPAEQPASRFSNAAAEYLRNNHISADKFRHLSFVTTKDILNGHAEKPASANRTSQPAVTKETNATAKTAKPLPAAKRREFEYLYSVNSSSVISRLSVFIKLGSKEAVGTSQHFIKSTPLPTIIHEVSKLLIKYPNLNSFYLNGEQAFYNGIHVGFAADDGKNGLKVAAIFNTDQLSLYQIEEAISNLSVRYAAQELKVEELSSCTFTITDLFNTGVLSFHPLVNSNNSAILGISGFNNGGFIVDLSFDHRVSSGREVSLFLEDLKFRVEHRFENSSVTGNHIREDIQCFNCLRSITDDLNGNLYFQKILNSKHDGYICSNCIKGW